MSAAPPDYSTISSPDPPKYSDIVANRPLSPPPPYADPTGSSATCRPSQSQPSLAPKKAEDVKQYIESGCVLTWILFLIVLALLHLVLFGVYFKCPLPKTSLGGIRTLFFLHIIFPVGMITYCCRKCKRRSALEMGHGLVATFILFVPSGISLFVFFPLIINDMTELNEAIQKPLNVTSTYPCTLSLYRLVFGVTIGNYVAPLVLFLILMIMCVYVISSSHCENTQVQPDIQA